MHVLTHTHILYTRTRALSLTHTTYANTSMCCQSCLQSSLVSSWPTRWATSLFISSTSASTAYPCSIQRASIYMGALFFPPFRKAGIYWLRLDFCFATRGSGHTHVYIYIYICIYVHIYIYIHIYV